MKRRIIITAGILLIGLIATAALAYGGGRGHGGWFCNGQGMMAGYQNLNLTADQTAKINALRDSHWKEAQPLRDKMLIKRNELRSLWLETNPDPAKINAAQKEVNLLREQMVEKRNAFRLSTLNVLTPEQKAEAQRNFRDRGFGFHRGPGGGPGGCPGGGPGFGGYGPDR